MRKIIIISLFQVFFSFFRLEGQDRQVTFSGEFRDAPFTEFVKEVEQQTGVIFYFREEWVRDIRVTVSGSNLSLQNTLQRVLLPEGLNYFIDEWNHIYLTNQLSLVIQLPDYEGSAGQAEELEGSEKEDVLTSAEQKYIDGRKARIIETIRIGDSKESNGQKSAVVHGRMTDTETGEPLVGATVYIRELKKGAATDLDGHFSLVLSPGTYTIEFTCMGMKSRQYYLEVLSGGSISIPMEKSLIPIAEVMVQANRFNNVKGIQMGFERLDYKVFKEIPLVMGERDVLKIARMLPGVQSVGEGSAGFNVRGSAADQNMIYVNRVPVYNSSHLFGFFTSINPEIVKDFTLFKSNMPASMGGRLASFFDITTRQGNLNRHTARFGISPITGYLAVEGPIRKNISSFILSARSTYSDWILNRLEDPVMWNSNAGFYDIAGAFNYQPGDKTLIKAFGYFSHDRFNLGKSNKYAYSNQGASVNARHRFNQRITGDFALVYGQYDFRTVDMNSPSESYSHAYRISHSEMKSDLSWLSLGNHKLTFGGSIIYYNLDRGIIEPYGFYSFRTPLDLGNENGLETGIYVADEITLTPQLTVYAGLRLTTFMSLGPDQVMIYEQGKPHRYEYTVDTLNFQPGGIAKTYFGIEPRVSMTYLIGENNSVKFSYNRMHQFLFMLSNTIAISPTDQWKLCDYHIKPPYLDQISLGYYRDFPGTNISYSLELYRKWISNVVEYRDGASFITSPHIETETLQGKQKAYGVEAMVRKNSGHLNGWLAYCYSRSIIRIDSPIPSERINNGLSYPSNFDRPHNLTLVTNIKMNRRISFSSNLVYTTGRPVTYPVSIYYVDNLQYVHYSSRNKYYIPDYFRLDLSVNMEGNLKRRKLFHSYWMLSAYNITGRRNAYSVFFQSDNGDINGYKLSIFGQPMVTLSWNIKLGNYASE
ncbi:MAG: hypothetical protein AMS27_01355 [Bacteroides sp. SM23_62_1]|nr:MAG: hypothetical protein AMS27_01355 [Bacteroides sp. SM23_62_1]